MPATLRAIVLFADERVHAVFVIVIPGGACSCRTAVTVVGGAPEVECCDILRDVITPVERVQRIVRLAWLPVVVIDFRPVGPYLRALRVLIIRSDPARIAGRASAVQTTLRRDLLRA